MSFYTALAGLNGSQADISSTSNNIANVGTASFKRSVAEWRYFCNITVGIPHLLLARTILKGW